MSRGGERIGWNQLDQDEREQRCDGRNYDVVPPHARGVLFPVHSVIVG